MERKHKTVGKSEKEGFHATLGKHIALKHCDGDYNQLRRPGKTECDVGNETAHPSWLDEIIDDD